MCIRDRYVADLFGGEGSQTKIFTALTNLVSSAVKFVSGAFMPVVGSLSTALVNWWSDGVKDFVARFDGPAIVKGIVDSLTKEVGGSGGGAFQSRMDVVLQAMANTFKALAGLIVAVLVGLCLLYTSRCV